MRACRICSTNFSPMDWQIKKRDFTCRACTRARTKVYRAKRKAAGKPVVSSRMPREYFREYEKNYKRDQKKTKAGYMARNAVRYGKLPKLPCEVCGSTRSEIHHPNYDEPLNIVWLCKTHHEDAHHKATGGAK